MEEQVILVDKNDNSIGKIGKIEAHQKGLLHRAISRRSIYKNRIIKKIKICQAKKQDIAIQN